MSRVMRMSFPRALMLAAGVLLACSADAQKANPFALFAGTWNGNGLIDVASGSSEKIRCRGPFNLVDIGNLQGIKMELKCAGDSYRFELQSEVRMDNGVVTGVWTELSRGLSGKVTGKIENEQLSAVIESDTFTATLLLVSKGEQQQITIASPGSELKLVRIGLLRSGAKAPTQANSQ